MLRRLCMPSWNVASPAEATAIEQLLATHRRVTVFCDKADTRGTEALHNDRALFLRSLEMCATALGLEPASRAYRSGFSANYRALFPDDARHYRVDVLEASADQQPAIWVNGDKFEFSKVALEHAKALQDAWMAFGNLLDRWSFRPDRDELGAALVALDGAWARFEQRYISELIKIEEQARMIIVYAITVERELQLLDPERERRKYEEAQRRFVACIAKLNSVANTRGKGRDDLSVEIIYRASKVLQQGCSPSSPNEKDGCGWFWNNPKAVNSREVDEQHVARTLAIDVVEAFDAMRNYLQQVSHCIERVDPHLLNNAGLVSRLVDWEESWEVGARYVQDVSMLEAVCSLVAEFRVAQRLVPAFAGMCDDCDVEFFLILPRLIWLCFLADPEGKPVGLLKTLLPHRFGDACLSSGMDPELARVVERFDSVARLFVSPRTGYSSSGRQQSKASGREATPARAAAWEVLVRRAISGSTEGTDREAEVDLLRKFCAGSEGSAVTRAIEDLMREVEQWSVELQRHCPEDWNQCSAVLLQCLVGKPNERRGHSFQA